MTAFFGFVQRRGRYTTEIPPVEPPPPPEGGLVAAWTMNEDTGASAALDGSESENHGTYGGTITGRAPLIDDGGSSVEFNGATEMVAPHIAAYASSVYTVELRVQPFDAPAAGGNRQLFNKDKSDSTGVLRPGGMSIEQYSDAGVSKVRALTRNSTGGMGSGTFVGASTGAAVLPIDVGHLIVLSVDPERSPPVKLFLWSVGGSAAQIATSAETQGWQSNDADVWVGRWPTGTAAFNGLIDHVRIHTEAFELADVEALDPPETAIVARNDSVTVESLTTGLLGVLANDHGLPTNRTITITQAPAAGTATVVNNGTPTADIQFAASTASTQELRYTVDGSNEAIVTISVEDTPVVGVALPTAPSANAYWVDPISGNDSATVSQARSSTTSPSASPWKTLSKAIVQWNAGLLEASDSGHVEIILRGGLSYERGNNLTITRSGTINSHAIFKNYRNDIQAGTRGGTGKFDGAKGRFCLRGNIAALESAGWTANFSGSRHIYQTTATHSVVGRARGNWMGPTTYNLQLVPARRLEDLDTDIVIGNGNAVYSAPGVVASGGRFHVRLDPNGLTDFFAEDFFPVAATWGTNPNTEKLAIYDDTVGLRFQGAIRYVDFQFWNIEYWKTPIQASGNSNIRNFDMDYMVLKGSYGTVFFQNCTEFGNSAWRHTDFIVNIPPWGGRTWIHNPNPTNGRVQGEWDALSMDIHANFLHDFIFEHNRSIRGMDGITLARKGVIADNIRIRRNHFLNHRDDTMAFTAAVSNVEITRNYFQWCFIGIGTYEADEHQDPPGSFWIGYNVFDLSKYNCVSPQQEANLAAALRKGTSGTSGGRRCGRTDSAHGSGNARQERMYFHNTVLCAKDANTNNGITDMITWYSPGVLTSVPGEHYNNIFVQIENATFLGGLRLNMCERDYNCMWYDPSGDTFGGGGTHVHIRRADSAQVNYASWAAFVGSGAAYNETKHANGDGPGSAAGWDNHGKFADPDFVNGKYKSIVPTNLATYFPKVNGNLKFAVSLTGTGWPECGAAKQYVGAYQPGDAVNSIGPEQGIWIDT